MSGWRSEKVSTIREEFDEINDSMKGSSSRMKNKVGAQKGAFIKMKQKNMYIYQRILVVCYVPIIAPHQSKRYRKRFFKSLSGFTPGLLSPETDALKFHALIAEPRHQNYHHGQ
ncbi:TPA: hypothetical protein ACN7UH_002888 [Klebsiella pneumoniae]|nr:hypothetical protein [Klebsiella pneumoniae]